MKNIVLLLFLGLSFLGCKKEPKPDTANQQCYPKAVTRTVSFNSDVITTRFSYDAKNKIAKEEIFNNNALTKTGLYIYNAAGQLTRKDYYTNEALTERDDFLLDATGKPIKLSHGYIDAAGNFTLHHFRTFSYTPEGKILEVTDQSPAGQIIGGLSYEHLSNNFIKTVLYGKDGSFSSRNEITFDEMNHPFSATDVYLNGLLRNEITHVVKDSADQVINTISNAITYNAQRYPVKIIQTHSTGLVLTEEFTY